MKNVILAALVLILALPCMAGEKIQYENPEAGVFVYKINTKKYGEKIKPYMAHRLMSARKVYDDKGFDLVVNGGYFDAKNGKSVSYVVLDENILSKVEDYKDLASRLKQEERLDKVLSRGEFRILEKKGFGGQEKLKFDIARHTEPAPKGWIIKHSLQAGPVLLPDMDLEGEGFVAYDEEGCTKFQAIDILKRRERTVLGLKGKWLYIVIFTKEHSLNGGEMRDYMKKNLKVEKALGLDGGLSTSISSKYGDIGSLGKYQRKVKSFLIIER